MIVSYVSCLSGSATYLVDARLTYAEERQNFQVCAVLLADDVYCFRKVTDRSDIVATQRKYELSEHRKIFQLQ